MTHSLPRCFKMFTGGRCTAAMGRRLLFSKRTQACVCTSSLKSSSTATSSTLDKRVAEQEMKRSLITACRAGKKKMNLALSLLTKMQRKGYEAPAFSYNVLMNLTGESDAHQSLRLLQSMQDNGPKPSVVSYNTVMKSFAREGNLATQNFLRK